jgi:hypothetical protein
MRWIKITAVFTALLLTVNIFLAYNLIRQYSNTFLIDSDTIKKTVMLLEKSEIYISEDLIPRNKPENKIYEGAFYTDLEEYYINTAKKLSGNSVTDDFTSHMINNGIKIVEKNRDEIFEFYNDNVFSFKYSTDSNVTLDKYTDPNEVKEIIFDSGLNYTEINKCKQIENIINNKFFGSSGLSKTDMQGEGNIKSKVKKITYYINDNSYIAECIQILNGLEIYGCEATCIIHDDTLIYAAGNIIFSGANNSYNTELYDQINVLFDEKIYIEQQNAENVTGKSMNGNLKTKSEYITGFKYIYCINWNTDRSSFYLIPAWYIEYSGETVRIRNANNGNIYTI